MKIVAATMILSFVGCGPSTIGGTEVPSGLSCEEDEVIGLLGVPDEIGCIHIDAIRAEG